MNARGWMVVGLWLLTAPAYASTPKGNIDGVASATRQLRGWACLQGSAQSVGVEVYVGGVKGSLGSRSVGAYNADQPSEAAVATACQSTGTHYRFLITFSASTIATHGGEPIYVYLTQSTVALSNSGNVRVPLPDPANDYVETVTYIQTDQQGSTVMETDAQGGLLAQTDYTPFGATLTRAAEAPGYTGHYEDPTTGLTYMQARYYDGEVARFLSVDPTAATPGDLGTFNRYAYARNNPMGYTDPDGRLADPGDAKTLEGVNVYGSYGIGGMLSGGLARSGHSYNYERYVPPADPGKAVTLAAMQVTGYVSDAANPYPYFTSNSFSSAQAAALDALKNISSKPDRCSREYGGWIYKRWSPFGPPTYAYDEPAPLKRTGGNLPDMPKWHETDAMFHNHPLIQGYDYDHFSFDDKDTATAASVPSYLLIPNGAMLRYVTGPDGSRDNGPVTTVGQADGCGFTQ